jgi:hypothetical protein
MGEQRRHLGSRASMSWIEVYASLGWRMFPAEGKRPIIKDWPGKATTDLEILKVWFREPRNVGLVTGEQFDVFDIEADHVQTFREFVGDIPITPTSITGRNGLHIYVKPLGLDGTRKLIVGDVHVGEVKSVRSGVLAPPSRTYETYHWIWRPDKIPLAEATDRMRKCIPPRLIKRFPSKLISAAQGISKLRALAECVANTPPGNRNAILYWAAKRGLEEGIPPQYLAPGLYEAAQRAGLAQSEIRATLRSALRR